MPLKAGVGQTSSVYPLSDIQGRAVGAFESVVLAPPRIFPTLEVENVAWRPISFPTDKMCITFPWALPLPVPCPHSEAGNPVLFVLFILNSK